MRVNKLEFLEPILNCPELGEILVGKNFINNIDFVVPCGAALTVLDCSDNKVCLSVLCSSVCLFVCLFVCLLECFSCENCKLILFQSSYLPQADLSEPLLPPQVTMLPEAITSMSKLKRLDVSNNSLNTLPPQLALMDNLSSLSVEGNPLRTMRREIIAKGTNAIKDYLK